MFLGLYLPRQKSGQTPLVLFSNKVETKVIDIYFRKFKMINNLLEFIIAS